MHKDTHLSNKQIKKKKKIQNQFIFPNLLDFPILGLHQNYKNKRPQQIGRQIKKKIEMGQEFAEIET
jgi:hypothetical protein